MEHHPKCPTTKGSGEWFTGDVWVDHVAQGHGATPTRWGWCISPLVPAPLGIRMRLLRPCTSPKGKATSSAGVEPVAIIGEPVANIRAGDVVVASGGEWHSAWRRPRPLHNPPRRQ